MTTHPLTLDFHASQVRTVLFYIGATSRWAAASALIPTVGIATFDSTASLVAVVSIGRCPGMIALPFRTSPQARAHSRALDICAAPDAHQCTCFCHRRRTSCSTGRPCSTATALCTRVSRCVCRPWPAAFVPLRRVPGLEPEAGLIDYPTPQHYPMHYPNA